MPIQFIAPRLTPAPPPEDEAPEEAPAPASADEPPPVAKSEPGVFWDIVGGVFEAVINVIAD